MWFDILSTLKKMKEKRYKQHLHEEQLDKELIKLKSKCPEVLIDYLFGLRIHNRQRAKELYESELFEYPNKLEKNILDIDKEHINIELMLKEKNICNLLKIHNMKN